MAVPATRFPLATNVLSDIASDVLREAKSGGATASETEVSQGFGQSVTVRKGEVETIAYNRDKGNGFTGGYASSRHGIYCSVIGEDDGAMQRDDWYTSTRSPADLETAQEVGRIAGERTARRLGARQLATRECPVLYEAPAAAGLIG